MATKYIRIHFGPCQSRTLNLLPEHKPQMLAGLKQRLRELGYRVDIVPVKHPNYCMLEMCGHMVFRCNVANLKFNTPYRRDEVCQRAVAAVVEMTEQLTRSDNFAWVRSIIDDIVLRRSKYSPVDYHRTPDISSLPSFELECLNPCPCCNEKKFPKIDPSADRRASFLESPRP